MLIDKILFRKHLEETEEIYFIAHKHWIAVFPYLSKDFFFGVLIPWIVYALFPPFFGVALLWTGAGLIRITYDVIDWWCDAWLITSHSIIDLEWKGIFDHTSSRVEYTSIEGVSNVIKGFWGTILRFGSTQIDRIGNATPAVLEFANNPKKIELKVLEYKELFSDKKGKQDTDGIKQILSDMVVRYIRENGLPENDDEKMIKQVIEIENLDKEFKYKRISS